jgi:hypothetical protein
MPAVLAADESSPQQWRFKSLHLITVQPRQYAWQRDISEVGWSEVHVQWISASVRLDAHRWQSGLPTVFAEVAEHGGFTGAARQEDELGGATVQPDDAQAAYD